MVIIYILQQVFHPCLFPCALPCLCHVTWSQTLPSSVKFLPPHTATADMFSDLDRTTSTKSKQDKIGLIRINRETKWLPPSSSPKHQRGSWESKCQDVMVVGTASLGTMKLQQSYSQVQGKPKVCFLFHTLSYQAGTTVRGDPPNT